MSRFPRSEASSQAVSKASGQPERFKTGSNVKSSEIKSHFAAVIAHSPSKTRSGKCDVLVLGVLEDRTGRVPESLESPQQRVSRLLSIGYRIQWKFPGGTNRGHPNESPRQTVFRELKEEVHLELQYGWPDPVHTETLSSHAKYFFATGPNINPAQPDWVGELRTEIKIEKEKDRPDEILLPPQFVDEDELRARIFPGHATALNEFLRQVKRDW
jgi:8-oxo-dGTP pyrophosphatase MutT (NUDIX family)